MRLLYDMKLWADPVQGYMELRNTLPNPKTQICERGILKQIQ